MTENVLITGGARYVGSHTCKAIAALGYLPIALDNPIQDHIWAVRDCIHVTDLAGAHLLTLKYLTQSSQNLCINLGTGQRRSVLKEDIMTMKSNSRYFFIGMLMILGSVFFSAHSMAQDLLEGTEFSKQYLVALSGTVMNETFSGAQALLTVMQPTSGSRHFNNPYKLIIEGFPKKISRNSFFWDSEYSEMTAIANEITCDIKRTFVKQVPMRFFFLSPELLKHSGAALEEEKFALKVALPTLINARAGKLKLRIHSNSVSGTVWMKGYDPVEKAFVLYSARLYGNKSDNLQPKQ